MIDCALLLPTAGGEAATPSGAPASGFSDALSAAMIGPQQQAPAEGATSQAAAAPADGQHGVAAPGHAPAAGQAPDTADVAAPPTAWLLPMTPIVEEGAGQLLPASDETESGLSDTPEQALASAVAAAIAASVTQPTATMPVATGSVTAEPAQAGTVLPSGDVVAEVAMETGVQADTAPGATRPGVLQAEALPGQAAAASVMQDRPLRASEAPTSAGAVDMPTDVALEQDHLSGVAAPDATAAAATPTPTLAPDLGGQPVAGSQPAAFALTAEMVTLPAVESANGTSGGTAPVDTAPVDIAPVDAAPTDAAPTGAEAAAPLASAPVETIVDAPVEAPQPLTSSRLVERVAAAVNALETVADPRRMTLDLDELAGVRLVVTLRGDDVHVDVSGDRGGQLPRGWEQELERSLAERGFSFGGGQNQYEDEPEEAAADGWRPGSVRRVASATADGLQL